MTTRQLYYSVSNGIRVTVRPTFAPQHSDPAVQRFVFIYRIRIENVGDRTAQLIWRHWYINDSAVGDSEVEGEGVVGEKPILAPGDVHEYESFCVLESAEGSMEGSYHFQCTDGSEFEAAIPKFLLNAAEGPES